MKNTTNRFSAFFERGNLFTRLFIVASATGIIAGTVVVVAMVSAPKDTKPEHIAIESRDEKKIPNKEELTTVPDDEKRSEETTSNQITQQKATQQLTPTPEKPPKDDNVVTVEDIPKDLFGWSEYHVYRRRIEVGKPDLIKGVATGHLLAKNYCRKHSSTTAPSKYAILCVPSSGIRGHMAFVEKVKGSGDIRVTEMNYSGWNKVSERVISKDQAVKYRYIP